jgi:hypothetical protein
MIRAFLPAWHRRDKGQVTTCIRNRSDAQPSYGRNRNRSKKGARNDHEKNTSPQRGGGSPSRQQPRH